MKEHNEKIPDPKEIEKEIGDFLSKKFGGSVKMVTPLVLPQKVTTEKGEKSVKKEKKINFDLKPEELISFLDQYIVKQDDAKAILSTKICTHFNRIKHAENSSDETNDMVGRIKNNILMFGPTGVGKTYMIRLIAHKLGVPFVKGDATKFSETGYVGGDVEDLVRDLVREADGDIDRAQYGIIYIGSDKMYNGLGGSLYALNPDGSVRWKFNTGRWIHSCPAIWDNPATVCEMLGLLPRDFKVIENEFACAPRGCMV